MKKKVTFKKFKEIYVHSGCALSENDIDYGVLLCMISNYHFASADEMEKDGYIHACEAYKNTARIIHDDLYKMGYFED